MNTPAPKHVPPPDELGTCGVCRFWQVAQAQQVVQTNRGVVPLGELIKQGAPIPTADKIMNVAQCSFSPIWQAVTDDHWCWQFKRRLQS